MNGKRIWLGVLCVGQVILLSGCTSALWERDRFAHFRQPANPANLKLFYSSQKQDVLAAYDEMRDEDKLIRSREYWVDKNLKKVNAGHKPRFVRPMEANGLTPIQLTSGVANISLSPSLGLCAVVGVDGASFTLYSAGDQINAYKLPVYAGASQRVKQVLLTPFAVIIDATIIGAVIAVYYYRP